MKKSIALILTFVVILTCFAGCKKGKPVDSVTDFAGEAIALVTKDGGGVIRDDSGNVVVYVTDADGNSVEGENGEPETKAQAVEHAIVIGTRIEMPDFAINVPEGWSNSKSYEDLHIKKDGTEDLISISAMRNEKLADVEADNNEMFKLFPGDAKTNKTRKVAGKDALFTSAFTTVNGTGVYLGFITFSHQGVIFRCMLTSDRNLAGEIDNIVAIINTIEFVH